MFGDFATTGAAPFLDAPIHNDEEKVLPVLIRLTFLPRLSFFGVAFFWDRVPFFGVDVHEMRIGFKNIGPKMTEVDALMAGEESGGFAFRGHIPERDGILSGLYFLEYMATTGKRPTHLLQHLINTVGPHSYLRRDIPFQASDRDRIIESINDPRFTEVAGVQILDTDTIDGKRFHIDDGWLAVRFSGTEPLLRLYAEAATPYMVNRLLDGAQEYLKV